MPAVEGGGRKAMVRYRDRLAEINLKHGGTVQLDAELQNSTGSI
jgi:hypothetical protein